MQNYAKQNTSLNRQGTAWGNEKSAYILIEIDLWGKVPKLKIVAGKAPEKWSAELWVMSLKPPFKNQRRKKKPAKWMSVHTVKDKHPLEDLDATAADELAEEIWKWCKSEMNSEDFRQCMNIIENHIQNLTQTN